MDVERGTSGLPMNFSLHVLVQNEFYTTFISSERLSFGFCTYN
jgi:hypothetical protein